MTYLVERTCQDIGERTPRRPSNSRSKPAGEWKEASAYILLAPPGAGKTTLFEDQAQSEGGCRVSARDFLTFDDRPEWHDNPLFIDGLDEVRAGQVDGRTPLDTIRAKLDGMGRPRFRLSCREADWFGASDRHRLASVSRDGDITVLRLDPLTKADARRILLANSAVEDPESFMASAERFDLAELLTNPQSLKMLALAVVTAGNWPETRTRAFLMACQALLKEHNTDHQIAKPDRAGIPDLMNAAGRLCAVQVLTGAAGYTVSGEDGDRDYPGLNQLTGQDSEILRSCLQTKIFHAPAARRVVPVHAQVAEFLGARFLAGLIAKGLPVTRILALITGHDGTVVSGFRGLAAWLAVHSIPSRREIIARDPLGTVLYGDAKEFSEEEKCLLLEGLKREATTGPRTSPDVRLEPRLGDLASSEMKDKFREILDSSSRDDHWQSFLVTVLDVLRHGEPLSELVGPIKKLIRDRACWPSIRLLAVDVFRRHTQDSIEACAELKILAEEVRTGAVANSDLTLLGHLLSDLYPEVISEGEIVRFLKVARYPGQSLEYLCFWTEDLPGKSTQCQILVLLDQLVEYHDRLLSNARPGGPSISFLRWVLMALLAQYLQLSRDKADLSRLFHWLGPVADSGNLAHDPEMGQETLRKVRRWLEKRPRAWKAVVGMGLKECIDKGECKESRQFDICMHEQVIRRLLGASQPSDYGLWCLDQALASKDSVATDWLLGEVAICLNNRLGNQGLSHDVVSRRLANQADLGDAFNRKLAELESRHLDTTTERLDWHEHVKPLEQDFRANAASPAFLHELAMVYFNRYVGVPGGSPRDRLSTLLAGDDGLVDAVLSGFKRAPDRDDLPSDRQILRLGTSGRTHLLTLPFMAGLEELAKTASLDKVAMDEGRLRLALAIHYTVPAPSPESHSASHRPRWLCRALSDHPEVVADVLVRSTLAQLRNGKDFPAGVRELAHSVDHSHVASLASMELLQRFPVRCTSRQLLSLNALLLASRRCCNREALRALIKKKCAHEGMNVGQRVHWLTAGLCIDPESYVERLACFVDGRERRVRALAEAVGCQFDRSSDRECVRPVHALDLLIRLIGASCGPYAHDSDWIIVATPEMNAADRVRSFIEHLAVSPTKDASRALADLAAVSNLRPWRPLLLNAVARQASIRREAEFAYCDIASALHVLEGGEPANAADLAALTLEHLNEIARDIRHGNASGWRQYWNVDSHNRPLRPRPEAACRDSLLSALRARMVPLGIDVQPERLYAADTRADISVFFDGHTVPIEIKKSFVHGVWSAIRSQLIPRYVRDPKTGGHGIYLVFWFGDSGEFGPKPPPSGPSPRNSREFKERLISSLSVEEQFRIHICVIDVAEPGRE